MGARVVTMKPGELEALLEARVAEARSHRRAQRVSHRVGSRSSRRGLYAGLATSAVVVVALFIGALDTRGGHDQPDLPLTSPLTDNALEAPECTPTDPLVVGSPSGLPSAEVSGVSRTHAGTNGPIVVWANATQHNDLTTLDFSTSETIVNGMIVSRSHLNIAGSNNQFRHGTEYGEAFVSQQEAFHLSGQNNCFSGDPAIAQEARPTPVQPQGFPVDFDPDDNTLFIEHYAPGTAPALAAMADPAPGPQYFVCGVADPDGPPAPTVGDPENGNRAAIAAGCIASEGKWVVGSGTSIPTGLYYVTGLVDIAQQGLTANITVVSGDNLKVQGSDQGGVEAQFDPYSGTLLFLGENGSPNSTSDGNDAVFVSGSVSRFSGIIHAPNGRVTLSGSQLSFTCPIYGDRVAFSGQLIYVDNEDCDDSNLTPDKENNVDGETTLGNPWTWTITVSNNGDIGAAFTDGAAILTDNLPNSAVSYSAFSGPVNQTGITGDIDCELNGLDITCEANGPVSIAAGGSFKVSVLATPLAIGTFDNPDGICTVDPDNVVTESNEEDNDCSDSVTVTAPNLTSTKANNVGGSTTLGSTWTWTITVTNAGNAAATFADTQQIVGDPLPTENVSYEQPTTGSFSGVTGSANVACAINASEVLSCVASGGSVTIGVGGSFVVSFVATPTAVGTFINSENICVDPLDVIDESNENDNTCSNTVTVTAAPAGALWLIIDEDSIDNGIRFHDSPIIGQQNIFPETQTQFSDVDVNDQIASYTQRSVLQYWAEHEGEVIALMTGQTGDEGWFAPNCVPLKWILTNNRNNNTCADPATMSAQFTQALANFLAGAVPQNRLDKINDVRPLRALGIEMLEGQTVCAVVYDSDISINYRDRAPFQVGNLQGATLGVVAFTVLDNGVNQMNQFSSSTLPEAQIRIEDASQFCVAPLELFGAPIPKSSSVPNDIDPHSAADDDYRPPVPPLPPVP